MTKTFIIDRKRWVRGGRTLQKEYGLAYMLNQEGNMCCLGQICKQAGCSDEQLNGLGTPRSVVGCSPEAPVPDVLLPNEQGGLACRMMAVNDDESIDDDHREALLIELAATAGWTLRFEG